MKKFVFALLLVSMSSSAWTFVPGYPEALYQMTGSMIESSGSFKTNVELVYAPTNKLFGLSFYNRSKASQALLPSGEYQLRACEKYADGIISGASLLMTNANTETFNKILSTCEQPIFMRVYDSIGNFATYRFENKHNRSFEEIK